MTEQAAVQRRCMFCDRAKGDLVDPNDPASQAVIMTREHIFRSSWKDKIVVSPLPNNQPMGDREFTRYGRDFTPKSSRPEPLFEVVVKPVCDYCNNGWMNDLDSAVEPWILDPYNGECDPVDLRRWAIKVAVLRSRHEHPRVPQPEDFTSLYSGDDIADWHIFVGRTLYPSHSHTFAGVGPITPAGGRGLGLTQVSWSLGHVAVVAIRLVGEETGKELFKAFKYHNRSEGIMVAEVSPTAKRIPNLAQLPELTPIKWESIVWYYSTHPLSPIAAGLAEMDDGFRSVLEQHGAPYNDL
ncbi:hypothetical protein [Mycolicibacterium wolinskyi]|uniref:hypothetical protein n=1 Tax=Mycolicibacterium wolinskyi TaxID=59750 RepID=UPI0039176D9D